MIFIVVKFPVKAEYADAWPTHVEAFTTATRAESGNLWFEWSRSVEDPDTYVLVEAFQNDAGDVIMCMEHMDVGCVPPRRSDV